MKNKFLIVFLVISLVFVFPLQSLAAAPPKAEAPVYLNLGDSIAFGMSAREGQSYFDKFNRFLNAGESSNLGVPGITSGGILWALENDLNLIDAVEAADVITISIGGNNLLGPIINELFSQASEALPQDELLVLEILTNQMIIELGGVLLCDLDYNDQMKILIFSIEYMKNALGSDGWQDVVDDTKGSFELYSNLMAGVSDFADDWPEIIDIIDENSDAQIFALNLYNPITEEDDPDLYLLIEPLISGVNLVFTETLAYYDYVIVDVNSAFKKYDQCLDFNLDYDTLDVDPHPTSIGHQRIFNLLVRSYQDNK